MKKQTNLKRIVLISALLSSFLFVTVQAASFQGLGDLPGGTFYSQEELKGSGPFYFTECLKTMLSGRFIATLKIGF